MLEVYVVGLVCLGLFHFCLFLVSIITYVDDRDRDSALQFLVVTFAGPVLVVLWPVAVVGLLVYLTASAIKKVVTQ